MSLLTFRDKNTKGDPVGPVWYLRFDAVTVEEFSREAEITQYPVETGAVLSDHYQPQPREISLLGVVSDTPTGPWTNLEGKQNAAAPPTMVTRPLELSTKAQIDAIRKATGQGIPRTGASGVLRPVVTSFLPGQRLIQGNIERARLYIPRFAQTLQVVNGSSFARSGVTRIASFRTVLDGLIESRTTVNVVMQDGIEFNNMMITTMRAPRVAGRGGSITFAMDLQEVTYATPIVVSQGAPQPAAPEHEPKKAAGRKAPRPVPDEGPVKDPSVARFIRDVAPNIRATP